MCGYFQDYTARIAKSVISTISMRQGMLLFAEQGLPALSMHTGSNAHFMKSQTGVTDVHVGYCIGLSPDRTATASRQTVARVRTCRLRAVSLVFGCPRSASTFSLPPTCCDRPTCWQSREVLSDEVVATGALRLAFQTEICQERHACTLLCADAWDEISHCPTSYLSN